MKKILLPTDLTVQSLSPVHNIVRDAKDEKLVIRALHMLHLPTSITDLLFIKESKPYSVPENFSEAFQMLRNKYQAQIESITLEFVYCSTARYLNNYIEANHIDAVYMLGDYNYRETLQDSVKFANFINKCKVPLHKLPLHQGSNADYHILSSLLINNEQYLSSSPSQATKVAGSYS
jgi:hypothetical protein